jgi:hypothetical protein
MYCEDGQVCGDYSNSVDAIASCCFMPLGDDDDDGARRTNL